MTMTMAPREELITSAITFLQDPSVANAPLEKRRAFLESKNLTNEEIDLAFARVGTSTPTSSISPPQQPGYAYPPSQHLQAAPPYGFGYTTFPTGPWAQQTIEPPKRDWRDWFIMATVTTGVGYGLYQIGKRYVMPLIKPPTPDQIEQDKTEISTQFDRAFTLIEQLALDTEALKTAETERNVKLDSALKDVEQVISDLRAANDRREQENRRLADDVNGLRDSIPKALEGWKSERDARLQELGQEMRSLKTLMSNRLQPNSQTSAAPATAAVSIGKPNNSTGQLNSDPSASFTNTTSQINEDSAIETSTPLPASINNTSKKPNKAAIPAWQLAAANNNSGTGST